ncbi:glutathione-regulated potassium-efflux system ancillary protein KefG [Photobacterium phosphoreum]|uniref:glutathione-regulated potassium-efflux system ancillary protein KefG n=1 Tax=Photobacterium phosphoreum TaxID=659 RepID=UPI000D17A665|nr:glutathione-regulated potassium-efflux system ancillary protein KefG [Photobacterium phosphoreum]PSU70156.1 glutathione-regulated potassium-efflux system ancillary protein KefG [Photobacterium phosphoreum]PSU82957.1 glutathione-regulated potassium-efflux system ancillary protein KefG [Photobacterium phosphoreum]PTB33278.1 glutathione-regulated potassium-efflux system ancillary protein KefG [Photobacterium phosphoreum]
MTDLKILIIFAHPDPQESVANLALLSEVKHLPHVTVHDLYATYPDFFIDEVAERALVVAHDVIIFQHPLYMYSCPALLKEWLDRVLSKGFAHGEGKATEGKYWRSVITTGGAAEAYSVDGYNRCSIDDILKPFELCADLCRMQWLPPLVLHWARRIPDVERQQHAKKYHEWLVSPHQCEPLLPLVAGDKYE